MTSTRDLIVTAAAKLLDAGGPDAVTLREVGRLAGVSHNAPYKHFADKAQLLAAVAARELQRRSRAERRREEVSTPAIAALRTLADDYVSWALRYPARFRLTFGAWRDEHENLTAAATDARRRFVDAVAAAQADGAIAAGPPDRVASLILALAHGAANLALGGHLSRDGKGAADPEDLIADLFVLLQHGHRDVTPDRSPP